MEDSEAVSTVPLGLQNVHGRFAPCYPEFKASILIAILPVLIVYGVAAVIRFRPHLRSNQGVVP